MKIVLTKFAIDAHFKPDRAGTFVDCDPKEFEEQVHTHKMRLTGGYTPFCTLAFFKNWTNTKTGTLEIVSDDTLVSEYKARKDGELPVLVRWMELDPALIPFAKYLCLVLYSKEHLEKEGTDIGDADYGIVAILGQMSDQEEPMTPMTAIRNALGIEEGGSGHPLDREAYARSVEFWNTHATVKAIL